MFLDEPFPLVVGEATRNELEVEALTGPAVQSAVMKLIHATKI
jgi:hypothetical protein